MDKRRRGFISVLVSLLLAFSLIFSGCGTSAAGSGSSSTAAGSSTAASASPTSTAAAGSTLYGKPWVTSVLIGNLPPTRPDIKDDVYTHFSYDYLTRHQERTSLRYTEGNSDIQNTLLEVINDKSYTGDGIDQMRILFEQAKDQEALKKIGFSEVQPYIDMIDAVDSIEKMNDLLSSEKFPFTAFVGAFLSSSDTRTNRAVLTCPDFAVFGLLEGSTLYHEPDDPAQKEQYDRTIAYYANYAMADIDLLGFSEAGSKEAIQKVVDFEKAYGKYCGYNEMYLKGEYGDRAKATAGAEYSLDQLCAFCPRVPLKGMLHKNLKDNSEKYIDEHAEWLKALNDLWTEDNLEAIKLVTKAKVLQLTRPYRYNKDYYAKIIPGGEFGDEEFAFGAVNGLDSFSHLIAKVYVEKRLGKAAKDRLKNLGEDLIREYKELIDKAVWVDSASAAHMKEKLDKMTLNILEPKGGFRDFSEVKLTPTDKGGSLFSNYLKLKGYRNEYESRKIGKPSTKDSVWDMVNPVSPQAFYDDATNSINVYPGIVTGALYRENMTDGQLLAGIGFTIGHEISHAFDYSGSQLDPYGCGNPVFSVTSLKAFMEKSRLVADYFNSIEYLPGLSPDGEMVMGEATADLSGIQACLKLVEKKGIDPEDFMEGLSDCWTQAISENDFISYALEAHPLWNLRINVSLQMFDYVYEKLGIKEGDGMYLAPEKRIVIWNEN